MAESNQVADKIDSFLKGKKSTSKDGSTQKSLIPLKKLLNCDWESEKHLRQTALECFAEMFGSDDDMSAEFRKQLRTQTKSVCENVLKMYMTNNDIDMLPTRG